jgi:hypothetical protein
MYQALTMTLFAMAVAKENLQLSTEIEHKNLVNNQLTLRAVKVECDALLIT